VASALDHARGHRRDTLTSRVLQQSLRPATHPLPLLLRAARPAEPVGEPQVLLGVLPDPGYQASVIELAPGDALICVTDGVTERTDGVRQLDDGDGLARLVSGWAGLPAADIVGRLHAAVHDFTAEPPRDDIAMLVLAARPDAAAAQSR